MHRQKRASYNTVCGLMVNVSVCWQCFDTERPASTHHYDFQLGKCALLYQIVTSDDWWDSGVIPASMKQPAAFLKCGDRDMVPKLLLSRGKTPTFHVQLLIYCMTQTCKNGPPLISEPDSKWDPKFTGHPVSNWARLEHPTLTTAWNSSGIWTLIQTQGTSSSLNKNN